MVNVKAGIKKIEIVQREKEKEGEGCLKYSINGTLEILKEILTAMDTPDEKNVKIGGYQELALRITQANLRMQTIEEKCGCKVKFKEDMEKRVAELENLLRQVSNRLVDATRRIDEIEKRTGSQTVIGKDTWNSNDKTVTDDKKTIQDVTFDEVLLATQDDKPSDVKRESLIREFKAQYSGNAGSIWDACAKVALARESELVERVRKPLSEYKNTHTIIWDNIPISCTAAIDKTLSILDEYKKG